MSAQYVDEGEEPTNIPARRRKLIECSGRILHKNILKLALAIEERGLFDGHGKLRVTWITKLESLINSAARIDNILGVERRSKQIVESPIQWAERMQREREGKDERISELVIAQTDREDEPS